MAEQNYRIIGGRYVMRSLERQGRFWHVRFRDVQTDRVYCRTTREGDRRRAERAALQIVEGHLRRETCQQLEHALFSAAWDRWLADKPSRESTLRDQRAVGRVLAGALGEHYVDQVQHKDLTRLFAQLGASRRPTTLRKYRTVLRAFWAWALRCHHAKEDPTQGLAVGRGGPRTGVALSREDAALLLRAAGGEVIAEGLPRSGRRGRPSPPHLRIAILLALHAGLRKQNVLGLRWRQVDLPARRIDIAGEEMKAHRDHVVPIHPELARALRASLARPGVCDGDAYVLGRRVGEVLMPFRTALRRAGLPPMRWHDLRHTASTWWMEELPIAVAETLAARRLGGEAGTYAHIKFPRLLEAVDAMPWIAGEPPATSHQRRGWHSV